MIIVMFKIKIDLAALLWHLLISVLLYQGFMGDEGGMQREHAHVSALTNSAHIEGQESLSSYNM